MTSTAQVRHRTGERCTVSGVYRFDGYVDGARQPVPQANELRRHVEAGGPLPAIQSAMRDCWWILESEDRAAADEPLGD